MKKRVWFADSPTPKSVKLPRKLDRRFRLTPEQIKEVKILYASGKSSREIGKRFEVSKTTILNVVNPTLREKANERARKRNQYKWANDEKWRKRKRTSGLESFKRKKRLLPEFRKTLHQYEFRRRARKLMRTLISQDAQIAHKLNCCVYPNGFGICGCVCHMEMRCKSSPHCSHNTNGRDLDKPCSIKFTPNTLDEGL